MINLSKLSEEQIKKIYKHIDKSINLMSLTKPMQIYVGNTDNVMFIDELTNFATEVKQRKIAEITDVYIEYIITDEIIMDIKGMLNNPIYSNYNKYSYQIYEILEEQCIMRYSKSIGK